MKNRYNPFGYSVQDGITVIVPKEAEVVQRIFSEYLSGHSLKKIAEQLAAEKVEYLPDQWQWNKNRVGRIISDRRYIGSDVYQAMIEEPTFEQAQNMKQSRNTQTEYNRDKVISPSVICIVCGRCGCKVVRIHDKRSRFKQKYVCSNDRCGTEYKIHEDIMIAMIQDYMEKANLIITEVTADSQILTIHRLEQEIARAIDYSCTEYDKARQMILDCANQKYQMASRGRANYDKLITRLKSEDFQINRRTVMELVSQIKLISNEEIEITLINGQVIGKEQ